MKAKIIPALTVMQAEFVRKMQAKDNHFIIVSGRGMGKSYLHQLATAEDAEFTEIKNTDNVHHGRNPETETLAGD